MFSNKFFRCPNFLSGLYVLSMIFSIILYLIITVFGKGNIYMLTLWIGFFGLVAWTCWCIYNIYENKICYSGFQNAGGFSWLWPFSFSKAKTAYYY